MEPRDSEKISQYNFFLRWKRNISLKWQHNIIQLNGSNYFGKQFDKI